MQIKQRPDGLELKISSNELDIAATLDCGQCFRFRETAPGEFSGVAGERCLTARQTESGVFFPGMERESFDAQWQDYFDLQTDYAAVKALLAEDETLRGAIEYAPGIRILRQDWFEALISFLISQNNNIPRIKGCIERLCRAFGRELAEGVYGFPRAQALAAADENALSGLGLGYRDEYISDCARRVAEGSLDLEAVSRMPLPRAREELLKIKGVGPKVAECALLFGFHQMGAFPIDTWMKKAMAQFFPKGLPERFAPMAGIAQQYLFHYIRTGRVPS